MTTAIILAGGLGTRLRTIVPDAPKPMALINGRPFLEYQMDYWIAEGVTRIILSVGYRYHDIMSHFKDAYREVRVDYAIEETPLGTGGGLLLAIAKLPDTKPFLVLNGDTFVECRLREIEAGHAKQQSDWTMVTFKADMANRYGGLELDTNGQILTLRSGKAGLGEWGNAGVYLINPSVFASLGFKAGDNVSLEQELLPKAISGQKRCFTVPSSGVFIDIGLPEDYVRAAKLPAFK